MGSSVADAQKKAYALASEIHWNDLYLRNDIAWRAIEREQAD